MELFSTAEAAAYLGVKPETVKYHVYQVKDLVPDKLVGKTLVFTRETLDEFMTRKRSVGRPATK